MLERVWRGERTTETGGHDMAHAVEEEEFGDNECLDEHYGAGGNDC